MPTRQECNDANKPVRDVLEIINGKWKLPILTALAFGTKRFNELERDIPGITPKMLTKDLQELEMNELVARKAQEATPQKVEYSLTDHGKSLFAVTEVIRDWGIKHRKKIIRQT